MAFPSLATGLSAGEIPASAGSGARSNIPLRRLGPGMSTPPPAAAASSGTNNNATCSTSNNKGRAVNDQEDNKGKSEDTAGDLAEEAAGAGARRDKEATIPISNVTRVMRQVLPTRAKIADNAKTAMQDCLSRYISRVTREANQRCRQDERRTLTAEDLLWSLGNLGFGDYVEPLKLYLQKYREAEGAGDPHSSTPVVSVPHSGGTSAPSPPGFHEQAVPRVQQQLLQYLPTPQPQQQCAPTPRQQQPPQCPPRPWQQPQPQQYPPRPRQQQPSPPPPPLPEFILGLPAQDHNLSPVPPSIPQYVPELHQSPPVFPSGDGYVSSILPVGEGSSSTLFSRGDGSGSSLLLVGGGSSSTPFSTGDGSSSAAGRQDVMPPAIPLQYRSPGCPIYPFNPEAPFLEVGGPVRPPATWYGFTGGVKEMGGPSSSSDPDDPNQEAPYSFFDVIFAPFK
ncbi:hypothetical protein Taro_027786 [Colocasia esculenta]|uniref:Transcription factor CBF/NF-Y/archaeal histone domain-containing protein n=1 Tax=Colocasia esculenta TaxID=4460 RepID=A0A843V9L2_COLES|nr:hypothetical protein [Colocasia esculenta]